MKVMNTSDIVAPKRSVLYWGPPKTGKTHNCLTWPKPFVIYWDQNQATLTKFKGIDFVAMSSFDDFENKLLPMLTNREIDAETIVFDSYSYAAQYLRQRLQGGSEKLAISKWTTVMDRLFAATRDLTALTYPDPMHPDRRCYNFVATVHERDSLNDEGALVKYDPAIQGQFKDWLPRFFDTVLVTEVKTKRVPNPKTKKMDNVIEYIVHSVPPNEYWICGDGVGGGLGDKGPEVSDTLMPKRLPPTLEGTYQSLMNGWGIPITNNGDDK